MSICVPTYMKLNIPQLTLAKLGQSGRRQSKSQEVPGSILFVYLRKNWNETDELPIVFQLLNRLKMFALFQVSQNTKKHLMRNVLQV